MTPENQLKGLERNNANAGGAYLERAEQQSLIRGEALIGSLQDIENIVIGSSPTGTPVLIRNVAEVRFAPMVRQGFATQDAKGEIVGRYFFTELKLNAEIPAETFTEKGLWR